MPSPTVENVPVATAFSAEVAPALPTPPPDPTTMVADPSVLRRLQEGGFDAGTMLYGQPARSTAELAQHVEYGVLRDAITADLAADHRADPQAGVGMKFAHRQFDVRWLASEQTRFELIGVVNRIDRKPFASPYCGEVRFVYRLSYRTETKTGPVESRLPMTLNVVSYAAASGPDLCRDVARAWLRPASVHDPEAEAAWLVGNDGPLSSGWMARHVAKSVEVNFQSVRWPSTVRPSMAGHAEYVLRVFHRGELSPFLFPAPLENTIDVARVSKDRALSEGLHDFLASPDTLAAIDAGVVLVPEKYLATRAVSVSPHGLARLANRPFASVLDRTKLASLPLSRYSTLQSPAGLLRRLDALSCPGCHQSRSIAGFHLLGVEPETDRVDALEVPMSPHLHGDLERRTAYLDALARGVQPSERRPPAERGAHDDGEGARCGLGDPGFTAWTCAAGLHCVRASDPEVGVCEPAEGPSVGDACEVGAITPAANPHRDTMALSRPAACTGGRVCEANGVGFPDGMCAGGCDALPASAACGGIPLLTEFNGCLGKGTSFEKCITDNTRPGALRACSFHVPCRDDYVCARSPTGGVCMPPYFLFQLRVDGHAI
jgi:hypothetical protein